MKYLARFCRFIVGAVFIFSGIVKLISPVGTSLIMKEYFAAFHLGFLTPAALELGIVLAALEFMTGVALLLRLRFELATWLALVLISIFTPLTLYLALFNPIADCGCFGEAVHLTNWQTFFKNLILLPFILVLFIWRKKIKRDVHPVAEWIFVVLFALFATAVLLQTFLWGPLAEFTDYKTGYEIKEAPVQSAEELYDTVFIYEKDGEQQIFSMDNLPDSTWTFVDATTTAMGGAVKPSDADFMIEDPDGNDITAGLLSRHNVLLMTIFYPDKFVRKHPVEAIAKIKSVADAQGQDFVLVASDNMEEVGEICPVNRADLKLLMTFNRSNGGVTLLDEGTIIRKWTFYRASRDNADFCGKEDLEYSLLDSVNSQRQSPQMAICFFILLCLLKDMVFRKLKR